MKRTLLILLAFMAILTACHKDDTRQLNDKRLKQTVKVTYNNYGYYTEGSIETSNFGWNDSLIVSLPFCVIQYSDDTITIGSDMHATKQNGRITSIIVNRFELWYSYTYTYNNEGQIISMETMCRDCVPTTTTFTWENGNMVQAHDETLNWNSGNNTYSKYEQYRYYTYDNECTPYDGMKDIQLMLNPTLPPSKNNVVEERIVTIYKDGGHGNDNDYTEERRDTIEQQYQYVYKNDYPVSMERINEANDGIHKYMTYFIYQDGTSVTIPQACTIMADANRYTEAGYKARGSGTYEYGTTVILQAFERDFIRWDDGNTDNPRTIIARGDATYTAIYTDN